MAETLINLLVQLVAGAIGGNAAAAAFKDYGLGMLGNTITGAIGGGRLEQWRGAEQNQQSGQPLLPGRAKR